MKNIFKPHVVLFKDDEYGVRKFSLFWGGWAYYNQSHYDFGIRTHLSPACRFATYALARETVEKLADKGKTV